MIVKTKSQKIIIIASLVILASLVIRLYLEWQHFLQTPIIPRSENFYYILQPHATLKTLAYALKEKQFLKKPIYLIILAKFTHATRKIKAGEYLFKGGTKPRQLLAQLVKGDVVKHHITFIEGWTFQQMLTALEQAPKLQHTLLGLTPTQIANKMGLPKSNPEGLFFPSTYQYTMGTTDVAVLQKAHRVLKKKLAQAWQTRAVGLPYKTPYQVLIVASMIEKETGLRTERAHIASVIVNRLRKRMYLQIDPTVIYGLGENYTGKLSDADLHKQTPYNTYKYKGLPPTPIALPSESSIIAATHPAKTKDLYFVAKGDGSHIFSKTLKAHDAAIIKYQLNGKKHE